MGAKPVSLRIKCASVNGVKGSLEDSVEERSCVLVIWREEVYSGSGGVS